MHVVKESLRSGGKGPKEEIQSHKRLLPLRVQLNSKFVGYQMGGVEHRRHMAKME
jgi:hypothetical protein